MLKIAKFADVCMTGGMHYTPSPGTGENTLRRLALFVYLDYPTKNDVTSGKKASRAAKSNFNMA